MHVPADRLYFVDPWPKNSNGKDKAGVYPKGWLDLWEHDSPGYNGYTSSGFVMSKYNHELFNKNNPGEEQITEEIFEEWYSQQIDDRPQGQSSIKKLLG